MRKPKVERQWYYVKKNCDTLNPGNKVNAVRQNTICKVNNPYLLLGGAQPVIPPNLYTLFYMFMNIIAWGPQIKNNPDCKCERIVILFSPIK